VRRRLKDQILTAKTILYSYNSKYRLLLLLLLLLLLVVVVVVVVVVSLFSGRTYYLSTDTIQV
jgi:hypothetical protein